MPYVFIAPKNTINKVKKTINPTDPKKPTTNIISNFIILFAKDNSYEGVANPPIEEIEQ